MEITLEKIELVKDRTGVSYAEAKEALEKADGSVVDAIILIEEQIDITPKTKAGDQASHVVEKIKELIRKGNVSKIKIKKGDEIIMNIPVNIGILCHRGAGRKRFHRAGEGQRRCGKHQREGSGDF